jgi:V-type H+-transporting ATPase subunit a
MFATLNGVVNKKDTDRLRRMVFRASRGNAIVEIFDTDRKIGEVGQGNKEPKAVVMILFKVGETSSLKTKLNKICDSFAVRVYEIPQTESGIIQMREDTDKEL